MEAVDELPGDIGYLTDIALQTGIAVDKAYHGLRVVALLDVVDTLHSLGIGGVATDAPYGVRRIEYHPTLSQYLNGIFYIFLSRHSLIVFQNALYL